MINVLLEKLFSMLPDWLSLLIVLGVSLLALLLAVLVVFFLIRAILRIQWKSQTVKRFMRICNEGNVTRKFLLRVDGAHEELKFQCLLDGNALPNAPVISMSHTSPDHRAVQPPQASNIAQRSTTMAVAPPPPDDMAGAKKKLAKSTDQVKEKSKKGIGIARMFAGIFGTLGNLLPGSMGNTFKEKSTEMQSVIQDANVKMQMPEQKLKSVDHLKGQVQQLNPGAKDEKPVPGQGGSPRVTPEYSGIPEAGVEQVRTAVPGVPRECKVVSPGFLQTPPLPPGESLCLELRIDPIHPYRSGEYSFAVLVRQLALPEMSTQEILPDSSTRGRVAIVGLSPIYRILSFLMALCAVVLNGTWTVLLISWMASFVF